MRLALLNGWLGSVIRNPNAHHFRIIDVTENGARRQETVALVEDILNEFLFEPRVIQDLRAQMGEAAKAALDAATPPTQNLRAGVFGEALAAEIYERWHAYIVPLRRLRITGGSPTGTDLLALRADNGNQITEICYVECKLRTTRSNNAAVEAHDQLLAVSRARMPPILGHVSNQLCSTNSPLYIPFLKYMASTSDEPVQDTYRIALTWESNEWVEQVLDNLDDRQGQLEPLTLDVIKLSNLRDFVEEVYRRLGRDVLNDGDEPN